MKIKTLSLMLMGLLSQNASGETLQEAWQIALENDYSLKAKSAQTQAQFAYVEAAQTANKPLVELKAGYTLLDNPPTSKTAAGAMVVGEDRFVSYGAIATVPLYTSGRIDAAISGAQADYQAAKAEEVTQAQSLKIQVAEAYVNVLRAQKNLALAQQSLATLDGHLADVQSLFNQQMANTNDLLKVKVQRADAQQILLKAQNALSLSQAAYNRLLAKPLDTPVNLQELSAPSQPQTQANKLLAQALNQRSELTALAQKSDSLQAKTQEVLGTSGPQVALSGSYEYAENKYQVYPGKWSVNLGVKWQVFDAGLVEYQAKSIGQQHQALNYQQQALQSQIALEIHQAWLNLEEALARVTQSKVAIEQAKENLKVNRERFKAGLGSSSEVLDANSLEIQAQINAANAVYDAQLASLKLQRASGNL